MRSGCDNVTQEALTRSRLLSRPLYGACQKMSEIRLARWDGDEIYCAGWMQQRKAKADVATSTEMLLYSVRRVVAFLSGNKGYFPLAEATCAACLTDRRNKDVSNINEKGLSLQSSCTRNDTVSLLWTWLYRLCIYTRDLCLSFIRPFYDAIRSCEQALVPSSSKKRNFRGIPCSICNIWHLSLHFFSLNVRCLWYIL